MNHLNPWADGNTNWQGASTAVLSQTAYDTYSGVTAAQDPVATYSPFGTSSSDKAMTIYLTLRPQSSDAMAIMEMFKCDSSSRSTAVGAGSSDYGVTANQATPYHKGQGSGDWLSGCEIGGGSSMANNRTGYNSDRVIRQFLDDTMQIGLDGANVRVMAHSNIGGNVASSGSQDVIENFPNVVNFKGSAGLTSTASAPFVSLFIVISKDSTNTEIAKSGVWSKAMKADADKLQTTDGNQFTQVASNSELLFPQKRCGTFSNFVNNITCGSGVNDTKCVLYDGVANPRGTVATAKTLNPIKQTPRIFSLGRRLFVPDYGSATRTSDANVWGTKNYDQCEGGCCCNSTSGVPMVNGPYQANCDAPKIDALKFNHYNYFKGAIRDMAIFNTALDAAGMKSFVEAVKSTQTTQAASAGSGQSAGNSAGESAGSGPTGGAATYNCTIQVTNNGTTTTQAGQHCYNGVYTGATSNRQLVGAGEKVECTISGFTFKVGLKVNGTGANTGLAGDANGHPTNAALASALNLTGRAQWATLFGLNNLLAMAKNDNLYNEAATAQTRYYLGPSTTNKEIQFQNFSADSCDGLEQNQHRCLKVEFSSAPSFTLIESENNRSYANNYYDYTVSAPFKFTVGGMNANAKEAIMENFKAGWNVHKPNGWYSGFNNYGKALTTFATSFDHYGAPTTAGRTAMSPSTGLPSAVDTSSGAYVNFEDYFAKSCGTSADTVAECTEDLSWIDGQPTLANPALYWNNTGASNDAFFFRNLNVTLGSCSSSGSSTGSSTAGSTGSSTAGSTGSATVATLKQVRIVFTATVSCEHITEPDHMARSYAATAAADQGIVSPGTAEHTDNYPCHNTAIGPCGRPLSCNFATAFATAMGTDSGIDVNKVIIASLGPGRRRRLDSAPIRNLALSATACGGGECSFALTAAAKMTEVPDLTSNSISTAFKNAATNSAAGVTVTAVETITDVTPAGAAAATTGGKKSSFANSRYSVNAVFPMLAAMLLVAFGMRA